MRAATSDYWEVYRQRMLDETEEYIEWGLAHPELVIEIPAKPAADGSFPPAASEWFWGTVLSTNHDSTTQRWRDFLLRRPKQFPGRRRL